MISRCVPKAAFATVLLLTSLATYADEDTGLHIAPQPLNAALREFAERSGLQVMYAAEIGEGINSPGSNEATSNEEALNELLASTGLDFEYINERTVAIRFTDPGGNSDSKNVQPTPVSTTQTTSQRSTSTETSNRNDDNDVAAEETYESRELENIIVTGTSIRGVTPESSPLDIYGRADFEALGVTTAEELFRAIPQNLNTTTSIGGFGVSRELNARAVNAVDLRGLGTGSTLTLLNGRRLPLADLGRAADASLIPLGAVERVEVLTDGASSIYGADAVAGVVNFVLREDFNGAETAVTYTARGEGGYSSAQIEQTLGRSWGSGSVMGTLSAASSGPLRSEDVGFSQARETDFAPEDTRYSAFASARQDIGNHLEVFADLLYADRHTETVIREERNAATSKNSTDTEQAVGTLGFRANLWRDRQFEFVGTYGDYSNNLNVIRTFDTGMVTDRDGGQDFDSLELTAKLDGSLFRIGATDAKFAVGGGYLDQELKFGPLGGARETHYAFGELLVPVIDETRGLAGINRLEFNLSARYTDTSDFGDSFDPKIGVLLEVNDALKLRGTWGEAFRAPTVSDLIVSQSVYEIFPTNGPFGTFPDPFTDDQSTVYLVLTGFTRPDLGPETSEALTLGFDFAPTMVEGLTVSGTYFDIEYTDRIAIPANSFELLSNPQQFAELISPDVSVAFIESILPGAFGIFDWRDGSFIVDLDAAAIAADATRVADLRITNVAVQETSGLDLQADYRRDTGFGQLSLGGALTYLFTYDEQITPGSPVLERLDTITYPVGLRGRFHLGLQHGAWSWRLQLSYVDSYANTSVAPEEDIDSWTTFDLNTAYRFDEGRSGLLSGFRIGFNVQNLFDEDPPFARSNELLSTGTTLGINYDPANAAPFGRLFTISLNKAW